MNQLSGKFVNVVLAIEEGRGMDFLKYPVGIVANFNGRILESDKVEPQECPTFNTELVWEVEKKDLRKVRTSNQPLRIECLTFDHFSRKERVGFTLLSLRSAMIIPLKDVKNPVPFHWQKLIGCQFDKKSCHPELYVSLTIRDHLLPSGSEVETSDFMPYISEEENDSADELIDKSFTVKYLEDGYVQIGELNEASQPYAFNLLVARAMNLDTLLPEVLVFRQNKERYFMSFKIFGITIKTKPFFTELHEDIHLNEKIVVRLLSSFDILKKFFAIQPITINFFCGRDKLGMTSIDLKALLPSDLTCDLSQMPLKIQNNYYFKFPSPNGIVPKDEKLRSPYIEIETTLRESCDPKRKSLDLCMASPRSEIGSGDQRTGDYTLDKLLKTDQKSQSEHAFKRESLDSITTKSEDTFIKNIPLTSRETLNDSALDSNKKYILEASIKSIIWKKNVKTRKFIFKFIHPTASCFITVFIEIDNEIDEENILNSLQVKMPYISTDNHVRTLMQMWKPKFAILDEEERPISKEIFFNTNIGRNDYICSVITVECETTNEVLAEVSIGANLMEYDIDDIEESDLLLNPPVLDEIIFVKELSDLQKWKLQEKNKFDTAMEEFKCAEMKKMQTEWDGRRAEMQIQLSNQMGKCKKLQDDLTKKLESIKTEKALNRKRNSSDTYEEIFQVNWKKYYNSDIKNIIEQLSRIERDNVFLRQLIDENNDKLIQVEKNTLTKEQTTNLLHELKGLEQKFGEAQQAKKYFKEQWKKACDEIHELRAEDYKQLQNQIDSNKKALSQLSLDRFMKDDFSTKNEVQTSRSFY